MRNFAIEFNKSSGDKIVPYMFVLRSVHMGQIEDLTIFVGLMVELSTGTFSFQIVSFFRNSPQETKY